MHKTFRDAAKAHKLLDDDNEWDNCLNEAVCQYMPKQILDLFAFICVFCQPSDPLFLWNKYKESMKEDFIFKTLSDKIAENEALKEIEDVLKVHGCSLSDFNLPKHTAQNINLNNEFNCEKEALNCEFLYNQLDADQRLAVGTIF